MTTTSSNEFNAIRISLASPELIRSWSYGEVTKPETINYRTLRPEKDGLFCERIFGPTKDWECYCGKYKKIRYKGVICDRCGVEVARAKVRRERMGHIKLAAPVAHIWFAKGSPSRLGLLLDLSPRNLERVLYFAQYIIISINTQARDRTIERLSDFAKQEFAKREQTTNEKIQEIRDQVDNEEDPSETEQQISGWNRWLKEEKAKIHTDLETRLHELDDLRVLQIVSESRYRELRDRYGEVFRAGMGAEAVLEALRDLDLQSLREGLQQEVQSTSGQRRKKAIKRLKVTEAFRRSGNQPDWMVLTMLPVLPPELRPMVQLDGGRFATSDLNDLYRRVINRNNRLRRLLEMNAPDIIVRNEKRMLQEAVDALIDNGRRGRAIAGSHNHKLKSLSDLLRGKQGRFRQNLLGKRVDYSGRSVIVVGPELQLHQCGIPKRMALELFKPFVMNRLILHGHAHNIKGAKRIVERVSPEVWDILEDVIQDRPVLLNRAPTLHRLSIQAFEPVLIEGSAIQLHPLVCAAFNADFDGDQMAVHLPLSDEAVMEARKIMLSPFNMLSPSSGEPIVAPTLDMVLGCYYLTTIVSGAKGEGHKFSGPEDARMALDADLIDLQTEIQVRFENGELVNTSAGRIILNEVLPKELGFRNEIMDKDRLKEVVAECYQTLGNFATSAVLDKLKDLGFHYATRSGITIGITDIEVPKEKPALIANANRQIEELDGQFQRGLITEEERYTRAVATWTKASDEMTEVIKKHLPSYGGVYIMATSGTKGNIAQIKQMAGMRGLMSNPRGRIIDLPIKSSFREGLSVLEYFISTHGARKGLADTALRTADSGYLTRRLVDVTQEVIILEEDCGTTAGISVIEQPDTVMLAPFKDRIVGRFVATPVAHPKTGEILADTNPELDASVVKTLIENGVTQVLLRSPLTCESRRGVCQHCYGRSLATGKLAMLGEAVGIVAAQSIGEPGTQLTMRTFHTGGVAGIDITSGLPRVEELFEARSPKGQAILSEIDGEVSIVESSEGKEVTVTSREQYKEDYPKARGYEVLVPNGGLVEAGTILARSKTKENRTGVKTSTSANKEDLLAPISGRVEISAKAISIIWEEKEEREYHIPPTAHLLPEHGSLIKAGDPLTSGPYNPQDLLRIMGKEEVQKYFVEEVQKVYRSQGVNINDKHIEMIVRQMMRKVRIDSPGDTSQLPGELIEQATYETINAKIMDEGGEPATASSVLLGVTRASLNTESFLAAASFQETARVLTEAAVNGATDRLIALKENVIIGRLIPARLDITEEGRLMLAVEPRIRPVLAQSEWIEADLPVNDDNRAGQAKSAVDLEVTKTGTDPNPKS
jgi:DNA-directed RNA polymerase subunit beta'